MSEIRTRRVSIDKLVLERLLDLRSQLAAFGTKYLTDKNSFYNAERLAMFESADRIALDQDILVMLRVIYPCSEHELGCVLFSHAEQWYRMSDVHALPVSTNIDLACSLLLPEDCELSIKSSQSVVIRSIKPGAKAYECKYAKVYPESYMVLYSIFQYLIYAVRQYRGIEVPDPPLWKPKNQGTF